MFISKRDIDSLVKSGGMVSIQDWCYDIIVDRLEQTGFKRKSDIVTLGPIPLDGSIYHNESGDVVVVTTHRTSVPITMVKSIPASSKEAAK